MNADQAPGPSGGASPDGPVHGPAFTIELARAGVRLPVPEDRCALDVVSAVVDVPSTCRQGTCGSCVSVVLAGTVDYRNSVLSDRAKAAGRRIALCVDRALTPALVVDL